MKGISISTQMSQFDEQLRQLIQETCRHPPGSLQRQRNLTKVIRLVQQSRELWHENTPYYPDALQRTWIYCCQHICESTKTGECFNPERASLITWLNTYLKYRLRDYFKAQREEDNNRVPPQVSPSGQEFHPLDNIPASPDHPPILETVLDWVKNDTTGDLRGTHIKGHPFVTCQELILRRLPPETSWEELSHEYGLPVPTLSSFYRRQCLPRLRKFGESEGYIE